VCDVTRNRPNLPHRSTNAHLPDATLAPARYRGNDEASRTEDSATLLPANKGTWRLRVLLWTDAVPSKQAT
jgi:hypothetical protein